MPPHSPSTVELLEPFIGPTTVRSLVKDWRFFEISTKDDTFLDLYGVSVPKRALVALHVELLQEEPPYGRLTPMRLHEMILDSWVATSSDPKDLRFVGFDAIVNAAGRGAMLKEFAYQTAQGKVQDSDALTITVTSEVSVAWNENPFLKCGTHLAERISKGSSTALKAHLVRSGLQEDAVLNIILEFPQE